jgi:acyl carrier protein
LAFSDFGAINVHASAIQCDVGDQASLESALASIRRTMPPLVGIFHAAVVIDDKLIPDVTEGHFADMMRVKVGGVEALDRLTRRDKIELFVAFSSVTTVLGSPGQASYVAANAAVEAVVEQRHRDGLPGIAVRWGPIADAGYLAREQALAQLLSVALGGNMLRASEALDALPLMLATGLPVIGLADIDWGRLSDSLKLMCSSEFEGLSRSGERPPNIREVRDFVINSSFSEAHSRLVELLTTEVARIMKMSVTDIGPHSPLSQLGMDSLMAVELRLAVEKGFGVTVPVLSLSEGATVSALAARMTRAIKRVDGGEDAVVVGVDATGMAGGDIALDYVAAQMERFEGARLVPAADALVVPTDDAR